MNLFNILIANRAEKYCNTIIKRNTDFIKSIDCMKYSLATEETCKIQVIKELLFEDVFILSRVECCQLMYLLSIE